MTAWHLPALVLAAAILSPSVSYTAPEAGANGLLSPSLPVPPIPPAHPPRDVAAPVPNANMQEPTAPTPAGPQWKPTLNERAPTLPGGDPVPGSLYRSEQEQRRQFIPNPGIRLVVPLQ